MNYKDKFENKTIMVTGGTGSFGNAAVDQLLQYNPKKIIIFSRDEKKQFDMGHKYNNDKLRFVLGDVRDRDVVFHAMYGVDYVFHAAALKQVPNCEFAPWEAIKTNSLGAHNVIDAALLREKRGKTTLCGTRYGNVMYTRGSVIPYFIDLMKEGKPIAVTDKNMTRFMMPLSHAIDLVLYALTNGKDGEIYVRKSPAATIGDLAQALVEIFNYEGGIEEIGIRPGEKMHESLISSEETFRVEDC